MDRVVTERGPLFARMAVQTLLSLMVMGAILFWLPVIGAGRKPG